MGSSTYVAFPYPPLYPVTIHLQGYHGAAVGKGRQLAKTELEKLKLAELTVRQAVFEAARMYVLSLRPPLNTYLDHSIHLVHDDNKDKEFELELSWVGEETNGVHLPVPHDLWVEADTKGREALDEDMVD